MLNQIHQLLTRRLVQKKEEPKANKFQFPTGFPVAAPGPLLVPGVCSLWRSIRFRTVDVERFIERRATINS